MSRINSRSNNLSFKPSLPSISTKPYYPPGALVPGQRPDKALNNVQFAAATSARTTGTAQGLTGRALEVYVAQAAMNAK
jgi:hypothetical protein